MMKMAEYKPANHVEKKHFVMRLIGGVFILIGVISGYWFFNQISQIVHPESMIEDTFNKYQIHRQSSSQIVWGYPTPQQRTVIAMLTNAMTFLGIGAYFCLYLESATSRWKKLMKFFFALLFVLSYHSATDFHYFDFWEWIPIVMFGIMAYIVKRRYKKSLFSGFITKLDDSPEWVEESARSFTYKEISSFKSSTVVSSDSGLYVEFVYKNDKKFYIPLEPNTAFPDDGILNPQDLQLVSLRYYGPDSHLQGKIQRRIRILD